MAKKIMYKCAGCGHVHRKEPITCSKCGEFGPFNEFSEGASNASSAGLKSAGAAAPSSRAMTISELNNKPFARTETGIGELDRVLGGGFVGSSVVLLGGLPGAGKSTLCLAIAAKFAEMGKRVLYASGEESEQQIGLRAKRMNVNNENIRITNEVNLEVIQGHIETEEPDFMIIDSLQTLASSEISGSVGSISQSKEAAHVLTRIAKTKGITTLLINQVLKDGEMAGSQQVTHLVDAVLMLDSDKDSPLKFLRSAKNRFGDISEVGVFQHSEIGLEEVSDPGGILLDDEADGPLTGTACGFIAEGIRQLPIEVQALVVESNLPNARKQFNGVNFMRGQIICGVLDKFCRTKLYDYDVYVSTMSGVKVSDPLSDLSTAAAILSSKNDKPIRDRTAFVGELALTGQIRGSYMIENKIKEAARLGFDQIVIPKPALKNLHKTNFGIKILTISNIKELPKFLES